MLISSQWVDETGRTISALELLYAEKPGSLERLVKQVARIASSDQATRDFLVKISQNTVLNAFVAGVIRIVCREKVVK
jgi:hypothetical protein